MRSTGPLFLKKNRGTVLLSPVYRTYSTKITRLRGNLSLHRISSLTIIQDFSCKINPSIHFFEKCA